MIQRPIDWPRALAAAVLHRLRGCRRVHNHGGALYVQGVDVPWVYGSDPNVLIEPWTHWHALHRKKNGFTAVAQRVRSLIKSSGPDFAIEVWEVDNEPLDAELVAKWSRFLERPLTVVLRAELVQYLDALERSAPGEAPRVYNPLLDMLDFGATLRAGPQAAPAA